MLVVSGNILMIVCSSVVIFLWEAYHILCLGLGLLLTAHM